MAKLYKVEMYILDVHDSYENISDVCDTMAYEADVYLQPFKTEEREIEWSDNIDLNNINCTEETYKKYFK